MRNILLVVEYDGSNYFGWQRQRELITIQQVIEDRLAVITGCKTTIYGAGRTDTGVHALAQVCNFRTASLLPAAKIMQALNSLLPEDIVIRDASEAAPEFHARRSAKAKTYKYVIHNSNIRPVMDRRYVWWVKYPLDPARMQQALSLLEGRHDFTSFRNNRPDREQSAVREILHTALNVSGSLLTIRITATGFLKQMVRNLVGLLSRIAAGKLELSDIERILAARDRREAPATAPATGLFLEKVDY